MTTAFTHGSVILEDSILEDGAVVAANGVISWTGPTKDLPGGADKTVDLGGFFLCPGFVDLHVHGGGGVDCVSSDPESMRSIFRTHESFGTTSLCLAVATAPVETTRETLSSIARLASDGSGGCRLLGAYLEGPFLNPARCGAHSSDHLLEPDVHVLASLAQAADGWLRIVSLAPELPAAETLIDYLAPSSVVVAIGHTSATFEQTQSAIARGCRLATHLFNGMKPFHHRDPNAVGAVLSSDTVVAELVVDDVHLHPSAVRIALRALGSERICLVTDATSIVGSPDGSGKLGAAEIREQGGAAVLADGRLAGSSLTMVDAVRNFIAACRVSIPTAVRCASLVPSRVLGISDRLGSITTGKYADLLVLDPTDFRVLQTYVGGNRVFNSPY